MKEREFAYRIRHYLNAGTENLDRRTVDRLFVARQRALSGHHASVARLRLTGAGNFGLDALLPYARTLAALLGLALAVAGVQFWNAYQQALENEEIDSALLADDLPINAYLDRGFQAWLDQHATQQ